MDSSYIFRHELSVPIKGFIKPEYKLFEGKFHINVGKGVPYRIYDEYPKQSVDPAPIVKMNNARNLQRQNGSATE